MSYIDSFKHLHVRPMPHSFGIDVPSDWADKADNDPVFGIYKKCGCWTEEERRILEQSATQFLGYSWCDVGCHTGLTSKTINWFTNTIVDCIDPMLGVYEFAARFFENTGFPVDWAYAMTSREFFSRPSFRRYAGVVIDGDHEPGEPLFDAQQASFRLEADGVILLHDFIGAPVREAVTWLMDHGFRCRVYETPHMVACCWRGAFKPPSHTPDPRVAAEKLRARCHGFDFARCE